MVGCQPAPVPVSGADAPAAPLGGARSPAPLGGVGSPALLPKLGPHVSPMVFGRVWVGGPVVGATIAIQEPGGETLRTLEATTNADGRFELNDASLRGKTVHFVATGGTLNGKPFTGRLETRHESFDHDAMLAHLNPATTMAARLLARRPTLSLKQAEDAVRAYLELPSRTKLGIHLDLPGQRYFDYAAFQAEVASGGFDASMAAIDREIDGGGTALRLIPPRTYRVQGLLSTTAINIAASLIGTAAVPQIQHMLDSLWPGNPFHNTTRDQFSQLATQLTSLTAETQALAHDMDNVKAELGTLSDAIQQLATKIDALTVTTDYNTIRGNLTTQHTSLETASGSAIIDLQNKYDYFMDVASGTTISQSQSDYLTNPAFMNEVKEDLDSIHATLVDNQNAWGLLHNFHDLCGYESMLNGKPYPFAIEPSMLRRLRDHFDTYVGYQLMGMVMLTNLTNLQTSPDYAAQRRADLKYLGNLAAQQALIYGYDLPDHVTDAVVINPVRGVMWTRHPLDNALISMTYNSTWDRNDWVPRPQQAMLAAVNQNNLAGYGDWRLATTDEIRDTMRTSNREVDYTTAAFKNLGFELLPAASQSDRGVRILTTEIGYTRIGRKWTNAPKTVVLDQSAAQIFLLTWSHAMVFAHRPFVQDPFVAPFVRYFSQIAHFDASRVPARYEPSEGSSWEQKVAELKGEPIPTGSTTPLPSPTAPPTPTPVPTPSPTPSPEPTPTPDTVPPTVTTFELYGETTSSFSVRIRADEPVRILAERSKAGHYGLDWIRFDTRDRYSVLHEFVATDLNSGSDYWARVHVWDQAGNETLTTVKKIKTKSRSRR